MNRTPVNITHMEKLVGSNGTQIVTNLQQVSTSPISVVPSLGSDCLPRFIFYSFPHSDGKVIGTKLLCPLLGILSIISN